MGPRPKGEGERGRRLIGPGLAHNATRVVICRRWVITELKASSSPFAPFAARHTGRRRSSFFSRAERDEVLVSRKRDRLTSSVNRSRQNTRVGPRYPLSLSSLSSRNFGAPWKKVAQDASQNGTAVKIHSRRHKDRTERLDQARSGSI